MTIGRFIPATIAHLSSWPSSKFDVWLNGVPPHRSTRNKISSLSTFSMQASSSFLKSSGPMEGKRIADSNFSWSPKIICADSLMPSAKWP